MSTVYRHLKPHISFNSNSLDIWQGFPVIKYIQVKSGHRSAILNLIKLKYPPETAHFFNDNGLAIWHGFAVITHIEVKSGRRSAILNLIKVDFFHGMSVPETAHFGQ